MTGTKRILWVVLAQLWVYQAQQWVDMAQLWHRVYWPRFWVGMAHSYEPRLESLREKWRHRGSCNCELAEQDSLKASDIN